ncbi:MAG: YkgJ family cysteine cluster protein [Myxococcales bacterium]|nr:YkgJ family cysteine cluster protein [Myxococcales bacterium]
MEWIGDGLRFQCQPGCGRCCTRSVREGSVFLEPEDLERLARALQLSPSEFARDFTVDERGELALAMDDDGDCRFLASGRCLVYRDRPLQCRAYPFLPKEGFTPLESPHTWRYEQQFCPGIGQGRLYRKEEIAAILRDRVDVDGFEG